MTSYGVFPNETSESLRKAGLLTGVQKQIGISGTKEFDTPMKWARDGSDEKMSGNEEIKKKEMEYLASAKEDMKWMEDFVNEHRKSHAAHEKVEPVYSGQRKSVETKGTSKTTSSSETFHQ